MGVTDCSMAGMDRQMKGAGIPEDMKIPFGRWIKRIGEKMPLTDEEIEKLDRMFLETRKKMIDFKADKKKEKLELEFLFARKTFDKIAVQERFKKLQEARTLLATERFNFLVKVRELLGPERYQALKVPLQEKMSAHQGMKMKQKKARKRDCEMMKMKGFSFSPGTSVKEDTYGIPFFGNSQRNP